MNTTYQKINNLVQTLAKQVEDLNIDKDNCIEELNGENKDLKEEIEELNGEINNIKQKFEDISKDKNDCIEKLNGENKELKFKIEKLQKEKNKCIIDLKKNFILNILFVNLSVLIISMFLSVDISNINNYKIYVIFANLLMSIILIYN